MFHSIRQISKESESRLQSISAEEMFAWLLACGYSVNKNPDPPENNRIPTRESPFIAGDCVSPIHGRKDPDTNLQSYLKFREIHSKHTNDIRVYTDGPAPGRFGGYGVVIFDRLRQMLVYEASVEIGEATNNVAELEAIHNALLWILENARAVLTQPAHVRLYTDSELARNFLLARYTAKHHSYLIESIQALGAKLRYDHASPVTLHWIPSHIEHTAWGKLPIYGNCRADKLAEKARNCSSHVYTYRQVSHQRTKLQKAVSTTLRKLEKLFRIEDENPDGPSLDDFNPDANQEIASDSSDT